MIEKKFNNYSLCIFNDKNTLSNKLSEFISSQINKSLKIKERFQLCACGGSTPISAYNALSKIELNWEKVDIFLGDERCVDPNSEESNSYMIEKSLLINFASKSYFYNIFENEVINEKIAKDSFINKLKEKCLGFPPVFDLTLLGLGDDGHTASLFPYNKQNNNNDLAIYSYGNGLKRISLTPKIISASSKIIFIVSGSSKQLALKRLINENESEERTPAKLINSNSKIFIFCDLDATKELDI